MLQSPLYCFICKFFPEWIAEWFDQWLGRVCRIGSYHRFHVRGRYSTSSELKPEFTLTLLSDGLLQVFNFLWRNMYFDIFTFLAIVIDQCAASVYLSVNNYLKNLLLWNRPTDFSESSKNDPWVMHFQNTSQIWIPWRTLVAMATERKNFKNLLVPNCKG